MGNPRVSTSNDRSPTAFKVQGPVRAWVSGVCVCARFKKNDRDIIRITIARMKNYRHATTVDRLILAQAPISSNLFQNLQLSACENFEEICSRA